MKGDDAMLLIEDGVYAAVKSGKASAMLDGRKVSVLGPDLAARGISEDKLADGIDVIDYAVCFNTTHVRSPRWMTLVNYKLITKVSEPGLYLVAGLYKIHKTGVVDDIDAISQFVFRNTTCCQVRAQNGYLLTRNHC